MLLFVVQPLSHVWLFATLCTVARQAFLSFTTSRSLLKLVFIEWRMPSNHLILCHLFLLPSIFPSIRVFSNELALRIRWPKYWSFIFSISPSNEYLELISFRIDWFDLPAGSRDSQKFSPTLQCKSINSSAARGKRDKEEICWWRNSIRWCRMLCTHHMRDKKESKQAVWLQ